MRNALAIGLILPSLMAVILGANAAHAASTTDVSSLDNVVAGDLIKAPTISAVYYLASDGKRYVFPNFNTYATWYGDDFSQVKTLTTEDLSSLPLGGNVTYRPGVRLLKVPSDPRVYAVSRTGILLPILSESVAQTVYGNDWRDLVDDIPESFFVNYSIGGALTGLADWYPEAATAASPTIDSDKRLVPPPAGIIDYLSSEGGFSPSNIVVTQDTPVIWFALDNSLPIISSVHGMAGFPSGLLPKGHLFQVEFPGRATYEHYNDRNSSEAGTVRVTTGPTIDVNQISTIDTTDTSTDTTIDTDGTNIDGVDLANFYEDSEFNFNVQYPDGWTVSAQRVNGVYGVELIKGSAVVGIFPNGGRGGIPANSLSSSIPSLLDDTGLSSTAFVWFTAPVRQTIHLQDPVSPWTACEATPTSDCNRIELTTSTSEVNTELVAIVKSFRFE